MEAVNILSVPPSCLRAFVPSCKNLEASEGQLVSEFFTNFILFLSEWTKGYSAPSALFAAKPWNHFRTRLSGLALLFSHEGTKARRHEEKTGGRSVNDGKKRGLSPFFAPLRLCVRFFGLAAVPTGVWEREENLAGDHH